MYDLMWEPPAVVHDRPEVSLDSARLLARAVILRAVSDMRGATLGARDPVEEAGACVLPWARETLHSFEAGHLGFWSAVLGLDPTRVLRFLERHEQ